MTAQLIFDPAKKKSLQCPFTFFKKQTSGKGNKIQYEPYSKESLQNFCSDDYDENTLKTLALLTSSGLKKEESKHADNYRKLNPDKNLEDYIKKYLAEYYFNAFRQSFNILSGNQQLHHKKKIGEKRYINLPCRFDSAQIPELSFKLERKDKKLSIIPYIQLNNEIYSASDLDRFQFLICREDIYFMLKKPDWLVLEEILESDSVSHRTYL